MGTDGDTVVLSFDSGYLYTCNAAAASFLQALNSKRSFMDILDILMKEYDVEPDRLRKDMEALTEELLKEKMIVIV